MSIPKYDELMKPLLTLIHDGQVYKMKDLYIPLSELYHLTEEEIGQLLGSGRQTVFRNRVGWASTYLNKAGLVNKPQRGIICSERQSSEDRYEISVEVRILPGVLRDEGRYQQYCLGHIQCG